MQKTIAANKNKTITVTTRKNVFAINVKSVGEKANLAIYENGVSIYNSSVNSGASVKVNATSGKRITISGDGTITFGSGWKSTNARDFTMPYQDVNLVFDYSYNYGGSYSSGEGGSGSGGEGGGY